VLINHNCINVTNETDRQTERHYSRLLLAAMEETSVIHVNSKEKTHKIHNVVILNVAKCCVGWLGSRVVSLLDSGAVGPGFKSQPRRCQVTVLGKLFTPIVPLFIKH